jgi:hypothetical protein
MSSRHTTLSQVRSLSLSLSLSLSCTHCHSYIVFHHCTEDVTSAVVLQCIPRLSNAFSFKKSTLIFLPFIYPSLLTLRGGSLLPSPLHFLPLVAPTSFLSLPLLNLISNRNKSLQLINTIPQVPRAGMREGTVLGPHAPIYTRQLSDSPLLVGSGQQPLLR